MGLMHIMSQEDAEKIRSQRITMKEKKGGEAKGEKKEKA